ncbi:MAG: enoyl-CoA hydratase-related protein [Pseudomonadota bacterium]
MQETWMAEGPVVLTFEDGVALLTLNRPEVANGMNLDMMKAIHAAVLTCHGESRVRAVHLRGAGKHFCAGGDVADFASRGDGIGDYLKEVTAWLQMAVAAMIRLDAVVVTEVHGFAAGGGGLGLVCASDIVIASGTAKFMAGATRVGMAPDAGASAILPALVGFRRAMDIVLTNRAVPADEAERIGLITKSVPDGTQTDRAAEMAAIMAKGAPMAQAAAKRMLWNAVGVEGCLAEEARTVASLSRTADSREGLAAVIEKRSPTFTGT